MTGEGRSLLKTVQDWADLLNSMVAYTGLYRLEGDKWITKVDVTWNPEWIGINSHDHSRIAGLLGVTTGTFPGGGMARANAAAFFAADRGLGVL